MFGFTHANNLAFSIYIYIKPPREKALKDIRNNAVEKSANLKEIETKYHGHNQKSKSYKINVLHSLQSDPALCSNTQEMNPHFTWSVFMSATG